MCFKEIFQNVAHPHPDLQGTFKKKEDDLYDKEILTIVVYLHLFDMQMDIKKRFQDWG